MTRELDFSAVVVAALEWFITVYSLLSAICHASMVHRV